MFLTKLWLFWVLQLTKECPQINIRGYEANTTDLLSFFINILSLSYVFTFLSIKLKLAYKVIFLFPIQRYI